MLPENDIEKMADEFKKCLNTLPSNEHPLMLVVDSLDQFVGSVYFDWIPSILHKYELLRNMKRTSERTNGREKESAGEWIALALG